MAVLDTTSPEAVVNAPKDSPSMKVPSSRVRVIVWDIYRCNCGDAIFCVSIVADVVKAAPFRHKPFNNETQNIASLHRSNAVPKLAE